MIFVYRGLTIHAEGDSHRIDPADVLELNEIYELGLAIGATLEDLPFDEERHIYKTVTELKQYRNSLTIKIILLLVVLVAIVVLIVLQRNERVCQLPRFGLRHVQ